MRDQERWGLVALGLLATAGGVVLAIREFEPTTPGSDPGTLVSLVGVGGLAAAAWLVYDRSRSRRDPVPWSNAGPIVRSDPEDAPRRYPLSGSRLAGILVDARAAARDRREVEDGLAVVRPLLRTAYCEAAVAGGQDRSAATEALDAGTWTDDRVAASVLSPHVDPPTRSLRRRFRDWLYPGRAVTRRTVRAVSAVATAGDAAIAPVIGSDAPRRAETYEPSLAVRDVGGDGRVRDLTGGREPDDGGRVEGDRRGGRRGAAAGREGAQ